MTGAERGSEAPEQGSGARKRGSGSVERWRRLEGLFHRVLELRSEERDALLAEVADDDPELAREVADLIDSHRREGAVDRLRDRLRSGLGAPPRRTGDRVGSYRILRELGSGGMGEVFLAEREDPDFRQRVALKLVSARGRSEEFRRRFLRERRILATLDHPNIARLLDAGVAEDGRPYLAMERVDGVPIDRHCDQARLGIRERLALFDSVCRAVHYAHRNLIVHRDLKPGNVLVTADGQPKLLDFGIAKLLVEEDGGTTPLTRTGRLPMTPEYASPEQVRGEPVTTASDVYSLGVLLYELLSGHRPHRLRGKTPAEIERMVCEVEPEPPSTTLDRTGSADGGDAEQRVATAEAVSRARNTQPERLKRRLAGDLDTIALKALRKEPGRRYGSAAELADDIERHLSGRPVVARPDTPAYRASKFVRRHPVGVVASALIVVSLTGGLAATTWQARRAAEQARIAGEQRDRARTEAEKAELASAFLVDLFEAADPGEARGRSVTADELLDRGLAKLREDGELASQPAVRAAMLDVMSRVYRNMGRYEEARRPAEEALEIRREALPPDDPDIAESLTTLGILALNERRLDEAEPLLRDALEIRRSAHGEAHEEVASALNNLAAVHLYRGELDSAEVLLRGAIEIRRALPDAPTEDLGPPLDGLAMVLARKGELDASASLYREALEVKRATLPPDHPYLANSLNSLATAEIRLGNDSAAEDLARQALAIWRKVQGDHPQVARVLNNLAAALENQGKLQAAAERYREALERKRETLGPEHPSTAVTLNNLGLVLAKLERVGEAEEALRESLRIRRLALVEGHPDVARALHNLGDLYADAGDCRRAEPLLSEALAIRRTALSANHPNTLASAERLGACLTDLARYAEAEALLLEALAAAEESGEAGAERRRAVLERLVELSGARGDAAAAARYRAALAGQIGAPAPAQVAGSLDPDTAEGGHAPNPP